MARFGKCAVILLFALVILFLAENSIAYVEVLNETKLTERVLAPESFEDRQLSGYCYPQPKPTCVDNDKDGFNVTGSGCLENIIIESSGKIIAPKGGLRLEVIASEVTYGEYGPEIDVYVKLWLDNNINTLFSGNDVDGGEVYTTNLSKITDVAVRGIAKYKNIFDEYYDSDSGDPHVLVLEDGDNVPDTPRFSNQSALPDVLDDFIDDDMKIDIGKNQALMLFEFNDNLHSMAADYQDLVILLSFTPGSCGCGPMDCNDSNKYVYPGAVENCTNHRDDDCDGYIDGEDSDCISGPIIHWINATPNTVFIGQQINFTAKVTGANLSYVLLGITGTNYTMAKDGDDVWYYLWNATSAGNYNYSVCANNTVNNITCRTSNFTVLAPSLAIALSTKLSSGVDWNITTLPVYNLSAEGNNGNSSTDYYVIIEAIGLQADLYVKADGNLTSGANQIPLKNEKISFSTTDSAVPSATKKSLTTNYTDNQIGYNMTNSTKSSLKFFLDVPSGQQAGDYSNNLTFKVVQTGYSP